MLERCGQDMFLLENEVDKLAAASGYTEITPALVVEMGTRNLEADVFDMVRCVTSRNAAGPARYWKYCCASRPTPLPSLRR